MTPLDTLIPAHLLTEPEQTDIGRWTVSLAPVLPDRWSVVVLDGSAQQTEVITRDRALARQVHTAFCDLLVAMGGGGE